MTDPFDTAAIRDRVLSGWSASPVRFREDANTEEDFALGGYRDRLVVELAQNAADAAARAGERGRLRLVLRTEGDSPVLVAANTGEPLTADGVESLATLRASAKRAEESAVGRFGVGFAAVLAVTDEPMVLSRTGGVRFSRRDTAELVAEAAASAPALGEEVRRRDGHVPVLRLPFEAEGEPPQGFDSAVVLPLRDRSAVDLTRRLLEEVADPLLLALPALERIEFDIDGEERVLAEVDRRWRVRRAQGHWTTAERERLLADRPTEERARPTWSVLWAIPRQGGAGREDRETEVLHAPTPTDEPLTLPALLIASFPLDPTRRHVAPGPLTEALVGLAADQYAELLREHALSGGVIDPYVPTGMPAGRLDGALREAILDLLPRTPLLRPVSDPEATGSDLEVGGARAEEFDTEGALLRPRDAVVVEHADPDLLRVLAPVVDGLVHAGDRAAYDALGVRRIPLADLVDDLATVGSAHTPDWWRRLYQALAESAADPQRREALGGLPVPLADGRLVRGPRGLVLLQTTGDTARALQEALTVLAPYGLRVVHPDAVHATLERLGAVQAGPRELLEQGPVRTAVESSTDADDPEGLAEAVLALVEAALADGALRPGELPWLGRLALPDEDDDIGPADSLVLPGSDAEAILDPDVFARVDRRLLERWGPEALETVGVSRTLGVVSGVDIEPSDPPDPLADLPDLATWAEEVGGPGVMVTELVAVRDLEYVEDGEWPRALRLIADRPPLRSALVEPVRAIAADGTARTVPSYSAWWIRRQVRVDGVPLGVLADPAADPAAAAVLRPAPGWLAGLDPAVRSAFGLVQSVRELDAEGVRYLLDRLADESLSLEAPVLMAVWSELGELGEGALSAESPERVRVLDGTGSAVVDADDAIVADAPMWLQRDDLGGFVTAGGTDAGRLADLLDLPLASESAAGEITSEGAVVDVPQVVRLVLPGAAEQWWEHEELRVDEVEVDWWVDDAGRPHAATVEGLARALAWSAGHWSRRLVVEALLVEPERAAAILADLAYDPLP